MGIIIHDRHSFTPKATTAQSDVLAIAQQAFAAQQKGIATGNWTDFVALLSDEIELRAPSPHVPPDGVHGKPAVAALLQKFTTELNIAGKLTQMQPSVFNETTVAIEFLGEGQFDGEVVSHQLVVFYEIENGKIKRFREYIGRI